MITWAITCLTERRCFGLMRVWFGVACPASPNGQWRADRAWRTIPNTDRLSTDCFPDPGKRRAGWRPSRAPAVLPGTPCSTSRSSLSQRRDWRGRNGCLAMKRRNWQYHVSRKLAGGTVVVEDLNTRGMTRSAKGTVEEPGTGVRQKAGLNRAILATGWSTLRVMLAYKAPRLIAVNAALTSRTCAECGTADAASRPSQATFKCVACGHADHADLNAARNISRGDRRICTGRERCRQALR